MKCSNMITFLCLLPQHGCLVTGTMLPRQPEITNAGGLLAFLKKEVI